MKKMYIIDIERTLQETRTFEVEAEEEGAALDKAHDLAQETKWGKEGDSCVGSYIEVVGIDVDDLVGVFVCTDCNKNHPLHDNRGDGCVYCGATVKWATFADERSGRA